MEVDNVGEISRLVLEREQSGVPLDVIYVELTEDDVRAGKSVLDLTEWGGGGVVAAYEAYMKSHAILGSIS